MHGEYALKAVIYQPRTGEDSWWIAQCLDYDISTQARHMGDAIEELNRMIAVQICASKENGIEPFTGLSKAPERFWMMFKEGLRLAEKSEEDIPDLQPYRKTMPEVSVYA